MGFIEFLFGKNPKIVFTDDGRAKHDHTQSKWDDWKNRFQKNKEYDWRSHVGTKAGKKDNNKRG
jgi:hypothetical protein